MVDSEGGRERERETETESEEWGREGWNCVLNHEVGLTNRPAVPTRHVQTDLGCPSYTDGSPSPQAGLGLEDQLYTPSQSGPVGLKNSMTRPRLGLDRCSCSCVIDATQ